MSVKQAVIFAGGYGTRMSELTSVRPKPTVEVGGKPMIFHICEMFYNQGITEFVILGGYKFDVLKLTFSNSYLYNNHHMIIENRNFNHDPNDFFNNTKINLVYTGLKSETGTRLLLARDFLDDIFYITYGDGLADVRLELLSNKLVDENLDACMSVVHPRSRYGEFFFGDDGEVVRFEEKPLLDKSFVNAGFGIMRKTALKHIKPEINASFEGTILRNAALEKKLGVVVHKGYFRSVDSLRDIEEANADFRNWGDGYPWSIK